MNEKTPPTSSTDGGANSEFDDIEGAIILRRIDSRVSPPEVSVDNCDQLAPRSASNQHQLHAVRANFSVPIVSVEGVGSSSETRAKHHRLRRRLSDELQAEGANCPTRVDSFSTSSQVSTTSEVNSNDDAASIASRLSQIANEQEFRLVREAHSMSALNHLSTGMPQYQRSGRQSDAEICVNLCGRLGTTSSLSVRGGANMQAARQQQHYKGQPRLKQTKSSTDVRFVSESRNNEENFNNFNSLDNDQRELSFKPSPHQVKLERGSLKTLESSRSSAVNDKDSRALRSKRSHSLGRNDQPMLNIRRSAWTLDEFEQTFKPVDQSNLNSATHDTLEELRQTSDASTIHSMDPNSTSRVECHLTSINSSGRNLLNWASRNSLSIGIQQGANSKADHLASISSLSIGLSKPFKGDKLRSSLIQRETRNGVESGRRGSRTLSIGSSIASSLESCRSARPFGRLGSLLSPGRRRHRKVAPAFRADLRTPSFEANDANYWKSRRGRCSHLFATLKQHLPILEWLPAYKRHFFWGDLTAGLAVAVLNISTSLSAAVVAQTELGAAFRSSIVNTLVYALLCSSRHTSFGSWSIMSQMLLDSVRRALSDELILNRINLGPQASWSEEEYETWHMNIIIMYTFLIGLVQLLAGLLNLGNILASFIPEALCSSMISATAFTMAIGQLANMCGTSNKILYAIEKNTTESIAWADLKSTPLSITDLFAGLFRWIQQIALLVKHYEQINLICVSISALCVVLLFLNQTILQTQLQRLCNKKNLFIPFELILLLTMIVLTHLFNLNEAPYNVTTCGPIQLGLELPNVPNLRLFRELWFDSLATALISYTMVFIMAKTYSNKFNYEVDGNQELIACGAGNLIGGLFDALPATASFSRTAGQVEAGGQTQMASLINCIALFITAQWFGHHVALLPVCVMSATLFYGFLRMTARSREALLYWRICKVDFAIWMVTFVAIITLDLVNGFIYGFIFSILTMLYRAQNRRCYMLGSIGTSDVYVPLAKYPLARELDGIKIFQFCGPIHYVSADLFERLLRQKTRVNVKHILQQQTNNEKPEAARTTVKPISQSERYSNFGDNNLNKLGDNKLPSHIILDFSMISFIDSAGLHVIKKIIADHQQVGITIMLASLASHVAAIVKNKPSLWNVYKDRFYVTLADAVQHALKGAEQRAQMLQQSI